MTLKIGDIVTRKRHNNEETAILTRIDVEQDYCETSYIDGYSFRSKLSEWHLRDICVICDVPFDKNGHIEPNMVNGGIPLDVFHDAKARKA